MKSSHSVCNYGHFAPSGFGPGTACIQDGTDHEFAKTSRGSGAIVKLEMGADASK